jgi:hypothetical protein
MAKGKLIVAFLITLLFAFLSRGLPTSSVISHGKAPIRYVFVAPGFLKNTNASNLSLKKVVIDKKFVKTRYMGGDCSFNIYPFSFHPLSLLFGEPQKSFPAYFWVPSCEKFLFSLRGPPSTILALT